MDLSVSAQNCVPSVVEEVEGDSGTASTVKPEENIKIEPESPRSDKTPKAASPADKTDAKPSTTEVSATEADEADDLETDGVCVVPSSKVISDVMSTKIKAPVVSIVKFFCHMSNRVRGRKRNGFFVYITHDVFFCTRVDFPPAVLYSTPTYISEHHYHVHSFLS